MLQAPTLQARGTHLLLYDRCSCGRLGGCTAAVAPACSHPPESAIWQCKCVATDRRNCPHPTAGLVSVRGSGHACLACSKEALVLQRKACMSTVPLPQARLYAPAVDPHSWACRNPNFSWTTLHPLSAAQTMTICAPLELESRAAAAKPAFCCFVMSNCNPNAISRRSSSRHSTLQSDHDMGGMGGMGAHGHSAGSQHSTYAP